MLHFRKLTVGQKFFDKRGGEVLSFFSITFDLTGTKNFVGGPLRM